MRVTSAFRLAIPLALSAIPCLGQQQRTWLRRTPVHSPSPRHQHAMAFDWARQRVVLFGGGDSTTYLADTWEWDGTDWTLMSPTVSPPGRNMHAMAYDVARQRIVIFGGRGAGFGELQDTWEYDGVTWTQRTSASTPSARIAHGMAYDIARGRTVLVSGRTQGFQLFSDTWEWDGANWTNVASAGTPPGREAWIGYDLGRQQTVLFGGGIATGQLNDTWEWDGVQWLARATSVAPTARTAHAVAFDLWAQRTTLFGGAGPAGTSAETWDWDGTQWTLLPTFSSPPPRWFHAMAFDLARQRIVMFGGEGGGPLGDTWELGLFTPASYATFGAGCGSALQGWQAPTLTAAGRPVIGQTLWLDVDGLPATPLPVLRVTGFSNVSWGAQPLPAPLGPLGPTCSLLVSPDLVEFVGVATGSLATSFPLPNAPTLLGVLFHNQFFALDPTTSSSALIGTCGGTGSIGDA